MNTQKKIKQKAREIGFDLIGITDLSPSAYQKEYRDSILKNSNENLKYLVETEEGRLFPDVKFPWAKSVVVLGINYWQGSFHPPEKGEVLISRYAIGKDYHIVLPEKLSVLAEFIKDELKANKIECYTDTGPLLEKELAEKAGLGWIGKNKLLITEEFGSWVFLGEVLVDIELNSDEPAENKCGSCNICVSSCPSKALTGPYSLDVEKCTAFQTVKKKGPLPSWFPTENNNYVFGCDICQEVCPYNSGARMTKIKDFMPDKRIVNPSLDYLRSLSYDEFYSLFAHTPVDWAGRDVFLRNLEAFMK